MLRRFAFLAAYGWSLLSGQGLDNHALTGKYFFRHLQLTVDATASISSAKSLSGVLNFDGSGGFTYSGQQAVGSGSGAAVSGNGSYSVSASGVATITSPQQAGVTMNARVATGVLMASSTEGSTNIFDVLVAVPGVMGSQATPTLNGTYSVTSLDFAGGSTAQAHTAFSRMSSNGQGTFTSSTVTGQMANAGGGTVSQLIGPVTYTISSDGSGTMVFPLLSGNAAAGQLISGTKVLYIAPDGNTFIAGSVDGAQDLIVGVKTTPNGGVSSTYFTAGLRYDGEFNAYVGTSNSPVGGRLTANKRLHSSCSKAPLLLACAGGSSGTIDFTTANNYTVHADGSVTSPDLNTIGFGTFGTSYVGSSAGATGVYESYFAFRTPASAPPLAVVNSASFAPPEGPVSPGELVTIFGQNLAATSATANVLPFPSVLGGIQVLVNGVPAPIYFVSPKQVSALIPFATPAGTATIAIGNSSTTVRVAKTSPGIYTLPSAGFGPGAVLHADYSVVSASSRAKVGETLQVFLTGLGVADPPIADGAGAPTHPLSTVPTPLRVYIGGDEAAVVFKGPAPNLAGLYQLNVVVPAGTASGTVPLAVETPEAFHDQVDLLVQ